MSDLALSPDPDQKVRIWRFLVGVANAMAGVLALNYGAERGVVDLESARQLTISAVAVSLGAYAIFRAGWNKSFSDPAMIEPQMMAIIAFLGWGYLIGGPGRVIALMLLFIALMFGMFTIRSRQLLRSCVLAAVVFGAAFLTVASREQLVPFSAELQSVVFAVLLVILVSVSLLGHQLSMMRDASARHKQELTEALAKLQGQAIRDELTGLFNRRHMNVLLNTERSRADRSGRAWCVCMIDLDLFKHVNDDYGHNVGDEVLRSTAQVIFDGLRDADQVARWGGEEFLVMFPDTDCQAARLVLERIRQSLARTVVSHTVPDLRVTFSAGVTCYITGEALTDTVDRADHALYQAKAGGRNRTERLDKPFDPKLQESIVR